MAWFFKVLLRYFVPANDTTSTPHEGNATIIQLPAKLLGSLAQQHEALRVGDNLAGVKGLSDVLDEFLMVTSELAVAGSLQVLAGVYTLVLHDTPQEESQKPSSEHTSQTDNIYFSRTHSNTKFGTFTKHADFDNMNIHSLRAIQYWQETSIHKERV